MDLTSSLNQDPLLLPVDPRRITSSPPLFVSLHFPHLFSCSLDCEKNYKSFANCKDVESAKGFGVTSVLVGFGALAVVSVFTFCKPTRGFALLSLILAVGTAALYIATLIAWAHFHKDLSSRLNEAKYEYSFIITVIAVILTSFASIISFLTCFKLGESRRDDHPLVTDDEAALKGGKAVAPAAWSEA